MFKFDMRDLKMLDNGFSLKPKPEALLSYLFHKEGYKNL